MNVYCEHDIYTVYIEYIVGIRRCIMRIIVSNSSNEPIYEQISSQIKGMIIKEDLSEGDPLPSIRGLARDLQISVITTKRAYEELEKEGFIETMQGKGSFVAMQKRELMKEKKLKIIEEKLWEVVGESKLLGLQYAEVNEMLKI